MDRPKERGGQAETPSANSLRWGTRASTARQRQIKKAEAPSRGIPSGKPAHGLAKGVESHAEVFADSVSWVAFRLGPAWPGRFHQPGIGRQSARLLDFERCPGNY